MPRLRTLLALVTLIVVSTACALFGTTPTLTPLPRVTLTPIPIVITNTPVAVAPTVTAAPPVVDYPTFVPGGVAPPSQYLIPGCTPRTDWPTIVVNYNETLSEIAERYGTTAEIIRVGNCLISANYIFAGQYLYVPTDGGGDVLTPAPGCGSSWFFNFASGIPEASACPGGRVVQSGAAGEDFEGGRAYYYAAAEVFGVPIVYIIYNDGAWAQFQDFYNPSLPASDPSIIPPAGRYQPVRAIGKVWRENAQVRSKLGWAYAPEGDFLGRRQLSLTSGVYFIDHGVRNTVLRLDQTTYRWVVGGTY